MFRDVLYDNISELTLNRILGKKTLKNKDKALKRFLLIRRLNFQFIGTIYRLHSQILTALETFNSKRSNKVEWITERQLRSG